ncbi:hypothetical protein [Actinoplanes sp. L3-i22]|uniref:hypothetical protein n=1 Tax=Actinoplanes sp. L3-i22 TaxID=2836373 RepID=UPI001C75EC68|nr:hypothetical protein [Actinoplanes sp. L3-i22]BCY07341.1 hypothetical protein L3i22_024290 [Actinoplanes sp. L3-i22]
MDYDWGRNLENLGRDTPPAVIDEAIEHLTPLDEGEGEAAALFVRAWLHFLRHIQSTLIPGRTSAPDDLDQALAAGQQALDRLRRIKGSDPSLEINVRNLVAEALQLRDAPGDLDSAVDIMTEATRRLPSGSPEWAAAVVSLGDRLIGRYIKYHRPADFAAAEQALQAATQAGWPERSSLWLRLGSLYEERFRAGGDAHHHRRALEILRTAWGEESGYPLLALSYADATVNSAAAPTVEELDAAIAALATVDAAGLPSTIQPNFHYLVAATHHRRFNERHDPGDLKATVAAAGHLIAHPVSPPDLRAEAQWIRATVWLDYVSISEDRTVDIDSIITDLYAAAPLLTADQRRFADTLLTRALALRSRRTSEEELVEPNRPTPLADVFENNAESLRKVERARYRGVLWGILGGAARTLDLSATAFRLRRSSTVEDLQRRSQNIRFRAHRLPAHPERRRFS